VPTSDAERARFCLTDAEVLNLADYAIRIEEHYSARAGHAEPMDIEWAKDADDGLLYIVQARPETVASRRDSDFFETYTLKAPRRCWCAAGGRRKDRTGLVRVITSTADLRFFKPGEVLVASSTSPDGSR